MSANAFLLLNHLRQDWLSATWSLRVAAVAMRRAEKRSGSGE